MSEFAVLIGTTGRSDFLSLVPDVLRFRSRAGTTLVRLSFLPAESDASPSGPGLFSPGSPTGFQVEAQDLPSSRATRLARVPCSSTPVEPHLPARCCLREIERPGPPRLHPFGAASHGPSARCLRFAVCVSAAHARLATGLLSLWPTGFVPLGRAHRFQSFTIGSSSCAELLGALNFDALAGPRGPPGPKRASPRHEALEPRG
jgi:hypothetical protein